MYFQVVKAATGVAGMHLGNSESKGNEAEGKGLKLPSPGLTTLQEYSKATHLVYQEKERFSEDQFVQIEPLQEEG